MSATSQALEHWHEFESKRPLWASRLPEFVRDEFPVAAHLAVRTGDPVSLTCGRCDDEITALSAHMVGTFLDAHNHCGHTTAPLWRCPDCHAPELAERRHCRACETPRTDVTFDGNARSPLENRERYEIHRPGYGIAARIEANSLREVLRAARAMFDQEAVTIHLGDRVFPITHEAK